MKYNLHTLVNLTTYILYSLMFSTQKLQDQRRNLESVNSRKVQLTSKWQQNQQETKLQCPDVLLQIASRLTNDKTLLPRKGTITENLEGDSKTYGQSIYFQLIPWYRCNMRSALRDQHGVSKLALQYETPGKVRQKSKHIF